MAGRPHDLTAAMALLLLGALGCAMGSIAPVSPSAPVVLDAVLADLGVVLAAVAWWGPWRVAMPRIACVVTVLGTTALVLSAATAVGAVATAFAYVWAGLLAAAYFPVRVARAHVAFSVGCCAAALGTRSFVGAVHVTLLLVITTLVASEVLLRLTQRLRQLGLTDPLTGVANRAGLDVAAERVLGAARRHRSTVAVAVLDLDGFKAVNDTHGHLAGDAMLVELVADLQAEMRADDVLARLGGDEFVVLLRDADNRHLDVLARRVRLRSATSWSFGATTTDGTEPLADVLARADERLYADKRQRVAIPSQRAERGVTAETGRAPAFG